MNTLNSVSKKSGAKQKLLRTPSGRVTGNKAMQAVLADREEEVLKIDCVLCDLCKQGALTRLRLLNRGWGEFFPTIRFAIWRRGC